MTTYRKYALMMALSVASATFAMAQTPPTDPTAPSSASSPHQRDSTATNAAEAPPTQSPEPSAAATPHQKQVTEGSTAGDKSKMKQAMKDCMAREQAKNSTASKQELKKTCMEQQKKPS